MTTEETQYKAMQLETLTIKASLDNLDQAIAFVEDKADRLEMEPQKKFGLLIALEEAFVNVCHYAYPESEGDISIICGADSKGLLLEISDSGSPFDVLALPPPDTTSDVVERQIGGLGIHFIRNLADDVSYRREDGQNILRIVVKKATDTVHA